NGKEAMAFLRRESPYTKAPRPDVILLDLNLPVMDGREVLAQIKSDPKLSLIPVIILTSSDSDQDILTSYKLNANAYVTKPLELEQFVKVLKSIENFWLSIVKLPPKN
ncbi:MAG: response regulator, partial [Moorea sp. SIO3I7]|nr:response regulator [Moorena sp. SIO3I7]